MLLGLLPTRGLSPIALACSGLALCLACEETTAPSEHPGAAGGSAGALFADRDQLPFEEGPFYQDQRQATIENPGTKGALRTESGGGVHSGNWQGYAFTWASYGSELAPLDFSGLQAGEALCAWGELPADPSWSSAMVLGVSIGDDGERSSDVSLTGDGINYSIVNPGGSLLRLQLATPDGNGGEKSYCVNVESPEGYVPWSSFNSECWSGQGEVFSPELLVRTVYVVVPGSNVDVVPYEFCIRDFSESNPQLGVGGASF